LEIKNFGNSRTFELVTNWQGIRESKTKNSEKVVDLVEVLISKNSQAVQVRDFDFTAV
jgi:hypothetical protein